MTKDGDKPRSAGPSGRSPDRAVLDDFEPHALGTFSAALRAAGVPGGAGGAQAKDQADPVWQAVVIGAMRQLAERTSRRPLFLGAAPIYPRKAGDVFHWGDVDPGPGTIALDPAKGADRTVAAVFDCGVPVAVLSAEDFDRLQPMIRMALDDAARLFRHAAAPVAAKPPPRPKPKGPRRKPGTIPMRPPAAPPATDLAGAEALGRQAAAAARNPYLRGDPRHQAWEDGRADASRKET